MSGFETTPQSGDSVEQESKKSVLDKILNQEEDQLQPWEETILPSRGVYYNGAIPGGVVKVKPFGLYADKVLSTQRLVKSGEALEYIFKKYVQLPKDIDQLDLLTDDRVFLLYYLRGITHGNKYEFVITCPQCNHMAEHEYNLNELYESARGPIADLGKEPFKIVLPHLSDAAGIDFWIKVRFLRGRDSMEMVGTTKPSHGLPGRARTRKNRGRKMNRQEAVESVREFGETLDETLELNINRVIVEVMEDVESELGSRDRHKIQQLVGKMHSSDIATIMDFLRDNSPGIDTMIEADCTNPVCGITMIVPLPITESFFRPKRRRPART